MKLFNAFLLTLALMLTACRDDKLTSSETVEGPQGTPGLTSLIRTDVEAAGLSTAPMAVPS